MYRTGITFRVYQCAGNHRDSRHPPCRYGSRTVW